jgi:hypothetical protein
MLSHDGLSVDDLGCPPQWPLGVSDKAERLARGEAPQRVTMNCSGKHAAFLRTCVTNGWDTSSYLDPAHPLQQKIKDVIEELQADRSQNVRLFEELVRTIPDGVRLVTIKQVGQELTLAGRSQSESRVSAYMRNLEASGLINNPRLSIIKAGDATQATGAAAAATSADRSLPFGFEMTVTLRSTSEEAEAEEGATPEDGVPTNAPAAVPSNAPAAPAQAS